MTAPLELAVLAVSQLDRWENVPFLIAFVVGLLFMGMQLLGFGLESLGGGVDVDAAAGVDADVSVEADAGFDADIDADADGPGELAEGPGALVAVLNWLNVGRAPFMVILQCFLLTFGAAGVVGTSVLATREGLAGGWALLYALPFAFAVAAIVTKLVGGTFARFLPTFESKARSVRSLVGLEAEVVSAALDERGGRAKVRDQEGDLHTIFCRAEPGAGALPRGERVVLVRYLNEEKLFVAARAPATTEA